MAKAKGRTTKKSTSRKAKTSTVKAGANSESARLNRATLAIKAIAKQLTKGATIVQHTVRTTLKHPLQPKGVVVACFARQNHVVCLLPTLGAQLKVRGNGDGKPDRNGTPFTTLDNGSIAADAKALGISIAKALKPTK